MELLNKEKHYQENADEILHFYLDATCVKNKLEALGSRKVAIETIAQTAQVWHRRISREVAAVPPKVIQKFVQPWTHVVQTEKWYLDAAKGPYCDITVEVGNIPVTITSRFSITPGPNGCSTAFHTEVTCKIPIAGRFLEDYICKDAESFIDKEYAYLQEALGKSH